jgi:hypothetical protein
MANRTETKNGVTIEVDDNYRIIFIDIDRGELPEQSPQGKVNWLVNVNVILRKGGRGISNAKFKVTYIDSTKKIVYFKNGVRDLPNDHMLDVGDPPIGII